MNKVAWGAEKTGHFIELVNNFISKSKTKGELAQAVYGVETFLYKYPSDFANYIRSQIINYQKIKRDISFDEKRFFNSTDKVIKPGITNPLRALTYSLKKIDGHVVFILHDGAVLLESYKIIAPAKQQIFGIDISRKKLRGSKKENFVRYLSLFSLINKVALDRSVKSWKKFLENYNAFLSNLEKKDEFFISFFSRLRSDLKENLLIENFDRSLPWTVVDTGLQGTFAILVAWILKENFKRVKVDFRLFSCYPWLPNYFQKRSFSKHLEDFPRLEGSVINKRSRKQGFFGRITLEKTYKIEKKELKRLLTQENGHF